MHSRKYQWLKKRMRNTFNLRRTTNNPSVGSNGSLNCDTRLKKKFISHWLPKRKSIIKTLVG